jgi:Ca2+-binding RTX toxin-like protein
VTASGTDGDDRIDGTDSADIIGARGGDDVVRGLLGPDSLYGNSGADEIVGGYGRDRIYGGYGNDQLRSVDIFFQSGAFKDLVDCGRGNDRATIDFMDRAVQCEVVVAWTP